MLADAKFIERFWTKVPKGLNENECWPWQGNLNTAGYGRIWVNGKNLLAHRAALWIKNGVIPDKLIACHKCDNPPCVNPDHLYFGTHSDNGRDALERGLAFLPPRNDNSGENHGLSKLTWEKVREMRRLRDEEDLSYLELSKIFHVSPSNVGFIITRKRWIK